MKYLPYVAFAIAFVFGALTWIAKYVWVDKEKTQTFAFIAIVATLTFMIWALFYSGI